MPDKKERIIITLAISISVIMLVATIIWRVAFFIPTSQFQTEHFRHEYSPSKPLIENTHEFTKTDTELNTKYKLSLNDVIKAARTWQPAYTYWFGRKAPDFTLTDINGKEHKLSDYRGKNVMIVFWATWCGPCIAEVPHLITLRNLISEEKLVMLAVSHRSIFPPETTEKVKNFVKQNKINYTVFSVDVGDMPAPYNQVRNIPCSFFIDPEGKIKLATEGFLSLGEIKAVLEAER